MSAAPLGAHVGSPDVFVDTSAGPYHLLITVRPPRVIPGVAEVEILTASDDVTSIRVVPTPIAGPGAKFAPTPEPAKRQPGNPRLFAASLWMMTAGAWEVRVTVEGAQGTAQAAVPVPTLPQATLAMTRGLQALLFGLMVLLAAGFVAIISALSREATLDPAATPDARRTRRGRIAAAIATAGVLGLLTFGHWWWGVEARSYDGYVYKPLALHTAIDDRHQLSLRLEDPGWIALRRLDDLVPDHGHLMHLFVVSESLDQLWHLHPEQNATATFAQALPEASSGRYAVFADIVHASGISETATASLQLEPKAGAALGPDDATWKGPSAMRGAIAELAGGGRIVWKSGGPIHAKQAQQFVFEVENRDGTPATDLELYMGMPGHAVFIRRDLQVFAHVHPSGSAPMAAMEISQRTIAPTPPGTATMAEHMHDSSVLPATVSFPYGIPTPGDYRIFVQVKRAGQIQTGAFDVHVE